MPSHEFSLSASDLDAAGKHYVFPVRVAWMRGVLEDNEATAAGMDGELEVRASKSGRDVVIHGTLKARLSAPCARCLEPVLIDVNHPVTILAVPGPQGGSSPKGEESEEDRELSAEEADTLAYDGETVILDDFVRDELMLETPMIPLCSEDCPGMSPGPTNIDDEATERPIDPRLMPLMRFQSNAKKKKDKE